MPSTRSLFKRVASLFRENGNGTPATLGPPAGRAATAVVESDPADELAPDPAGRAADARNSTRWTRWRRSTKGELHAGYLRTIELMDAMQEHFQRQDHRAEQLIASVERIGQTLRDTVEQQRAQNDRITAIARSVDHAGGHAERLSLVLDALPSALLSQSQAVQAVARQMEASHAADAELMQSLERFGHSVESLRESGTVQVATLERLHLENRDDRKALRDFVRARDRRFVVVVAVAGTLGIGALTALVFALIQIVSL